MFSEDIVLADWNIRAVGKVNVVNEIEKIFASARTIKITLISFFKGSDYSYAVLILITINGGQGMEVIDVINLNVDGKIESINAFRIEGI